MEKKIRATIIGGTGYTGGELLRLLLWHPGIEIQNITSRSLAGKYITHNHPNLRKHTNLKYSDQDKLEHTDILFSCLPHGVLLETIDNYLDLATRIVDLSSDFRLSTPELYEKWYGRQHPRPELLTKFVYGIPEMNRKDICNAKFVATAGCNATVSLLALLPFFNDNGYIKNVIADLKVPSSEGGKNHSQASHHPERSRSLRSYKPTGHRHAAELIDCFSIDPNLMNFTATTTDLVRGVLATIHCWFDKQYSQKDLWRLFRSAYGNEPFIRIVNERSGIHRYPDPKLLIGTNYCDVGFDIDKETGRIVVISALDNLVKGAAGQAVHVANLMTGFDEMTGLEFPGLHPL